MIKFEDIKSQEDLDRVINEAQSKTRANYEEAANRTKNKLDAYESKIKEFENIQTKYNELKAEKDKQVLSTKLNKFNPKYHDLLIQKGNLTPEMKEEEMKKSLKQLEKDYDDLLINPTIPTKSPTNQVSEKPLSMKEELEKIKQSK